MVGRNCAKMIMEKYDADMQALIAVRLELAEVKEKLAEYERPQVA